jgi:hypothetical protein
MANLIRLKQIESGSQLNTAASVGADFSASVTEIVSQSLETSFSASIVNIILNNVTAVLPDGIISSSTQVDIKETTNFVEFSSSISTSIAETNINVISFSSSVASTFDDVYTELEIGLSASIATSISHSNLIFNELSASVQSQLSSSLSNTIVISESVNSRLANLEIFSSSLNDTFATDAELTTTSSQILDQGEW